jgi:tetratricopeptide (TPR) repeat protein
MYKLLFFLALILCFANAYSQPLPDSTKAQYAAAKNDKEKEQSLVAYFKQQPLNDATTKANALQLKSWFEKQKDATGINYTNLRLAGILENNGDFPGALNLAFSVLPQFEERKDSFGILTTYGFIGSTYMAAKDYLNAAVYSKKEISIVKAGNDKNKLSSAYNAIACVYGEGNMPDSGMVYAQKSVNIAGELKNYQQLALSTSTLGENYIAAGEYDLALPFLRRTASYYKENGALSPYLDAYLKNDFAQVFLATKIYDSANFYARQALMVSIPADVKDESRRSYEYLYKSFEQTNQQDSLNKYFRLSMLIKDSLLSLEKVKNIQALTFHEQLRQQESDSEKLRAEEERKLNIQYALIALGIIIFVTAFLAFSRTHVANEKLISFFAILGLLIVFEFINLLIHPWLASITHESPVLMLLILVVIASLLIPLHHRLEHWIKEKMIEKNKAIRLAAAKKTIRLLSDEKPEKS